MSEPHSFVLFYVCIKDWIRTDDRSSLTDLTNAIKEMNDDDPGTCWGTYIKDDLLNYIGLPHEAYWKKFIRPT